MTEATNTRRDALEEAAQEAERIGSAWAEDADCPKTSRAVGRRIAETIRSLKGGANTPAGVKAWSGGDTAPADWDGGPVRLRNGYVAQAAYWGHPAPAAPGYEGDNDIVAYRAQRDARGLRKQRSRGLSDNEVMLDAQNSCAPCKLCGGKAIISDAGPGAGYYVRCENSGAYRAAMGCMVAESRLGGWAYNVSDWWNRLHAPGYEGDNDIVAYKSKAQAPNNKPPALGCRQPATPQTTAGSGPATNGFLREERFIVIKRKHLSEMQERQLRTYLAQNLRVQTVECVVVESDWPEYETVWRMIEQRGRCPGAWAPAEHLRQANERIAELERALGAAPIPGRREEMKDFRDRQDKWFASITRALARHHQKVGE